MISGVITSQTGGRRFNGKDFLKYSHFVGGLNSTHHSLLQYSPQHGGYHRLFMVRPPKVVIDYFGGKDDHKYSEDSEFMIFKHAMEYMLGGFSGLSDISLEASGVNLQGGYAGKQIYIPTVTKDSTETVTTKLYEMNGSLIFSVIDTWMNMIGDQNSGLATYGGLISGGINDSGVETRISQINGDSRGAYAYNEANHTAEFIYMLTDKSGAQVERAWLLAGAWPKTIAQGVAGDFTPGTHDIVVYDVTWQCNVYRSPIITAIANALLKQYLIISNYLNFNPELGDAVWETRDGSTYFNSHFGGVPADSASGTNLVNTPVFTSTNSPATKEVAPQDITGGPMYAGLGTRGTFSNFAGVAVPTSGATYEPGSYTIGDQTITITNNTPESGT